MQSMILGLLILFLAAGAAEARTWTVFPDGTGDAPTIQAAIDSTVHHDTVLAAPGTYHEAIRFLGKKITVGSYFSVTADTSYISRTVIDADQLGCSVVTFDHDEEPSAILEGLTLTHGQGNWMGYIYGGGIFCLDASPTLRHLIIRDCMSVAMNAFGGGICVLDGAPLIEQVLLESNSAWEGAGIECVGSYAHPTVQNSIVRGNTAAWGSGVGLYAGATAVLDGVQIVDNRMHSNGPGFGIHCGEESRIVLARTTLSRNGGGGLLLSSNSSAVFVNSIVWGNDPTEVSFLPGYPSCSAVLAHCDIRGGLDGVETNGNGVVDWLEGNIDSDPLFWNPEAGNYRLLPDSPCIDAGTDFFSWEGEVLVDLGPEDYCGEAPDIGASEFCMESATVDDRPPNSPLAVRVIPNPATSMVTIAFGLGRSESIEVTVHSISGRCIAHLLGDRRSSGWHSVVWDGTDDRGHRVPGGTYLARLRSEQHTGSQKILLLR